MRTSLIAIALIAAIPAACTAEPAAQADSMETVVDAVAAVNDDIKVPVYTGPSGAETAAVSGFDTVSYFIGDGTPVMGTAEHRVSYNGVEYQFANAENAATFQAEPAKFAPQYGGHCAWAASKGKLAPGDPKLAKVVDGKLYLNFNETVQKTWNADIPGFIEKADKEFPAISADARYDDA